jgi:hypothetical protein
MIENKDVYRCYSTNLMQFMADNDVRYFLIAIDVVTHRQFWAYEKTKRFNKLLKLWTDNNPKKK